MSHRADRHLFHEAAWRCFLVSAIETSMAVLLAVVCSKHANDGILFVIGAFVAVVVGMLSVLHWVCAAFIMRCRSAAVMGAEMVSWVQLGTLWVVIVVGGFWTLQMLYLLIPLAVYALLEWWMLAGLAKITAHPIAPARRVRARDAIFATRAQ